MWHTFIPAWNNSDIRKNCKWLTLLCNDVWIKAQVKILHVKSVENASKRPTWKTKEQSFPKYGTLLRKQWVWNEESLTHLSFLYFSHYDTFALRTRALIICWSFCFKLTFGCLFAFVIPPICTFLAKITTVEGWENTDFSVGDTEKI